MARAVLWFSVIACPPNKQSYHHACKYHKLVHTSSQYMRNTLVPDFSLSSEPAHLPATPLLSAVVSVVSQQNAISGQRRAVYCSGNKTRSPRIRPRRQRYLYPPATLICPPCASSTLMSKKGGRQSQPQRQKKAAAAAVTESAVEWQANKIKRRLHHRRI